MGEITGRQRFAHLLRRAGFGGSPEEIDAAMRLGWDAALDQLIDYERVSNDQLEAQVAALEADVLGQQRPQLPAVQAIWLFRMLNTARPGTAPALHILDKGSSWLQHRRVHRTSNRRQTMTAEDSLHLQRPNV